MLYPNGDVYKGSYKNGERSGAGLCKFGKTGSIFKGEWRDDKPQGNGVLFTLPNEIIEARFDGFHVIDGQAKILMSNGEFYEGNIKQNMRNSTGIHYYRNGDSYEGEWLNDKRVGRGRIFKADGSKMSGMFAEDKADGYVEFEDRVGNLFQSENEDASKATAGTKSKKISLSINDQQQGSFIPGQFMNGRLYK